MPKHHRHHSDLAQRTEYATSSAAGHSETQTTVSGHGNPLATRCIPAEVSGPQARSSAPHQPNGAQHLVVKQVQTHRRQTSHPAVLQSSGATAVPPVVAATSRTLPQQHVSVTRSIIILLLCQVASFFYNSDIIYRHASNPVTQPAQLPVVVNTQVRGHKRSHSYGYHRNPPMFQQSHRRTGSSVIDTLQTLTCTAPSEQELHPHESIMQFLENLRKEQQEK